MEITTSGELRAWDALAARETPEVCAAAAVAIEPRGGRYRVACFGKPFVVDPSARRVTAADAGGRLLLERLGGHLQLVLPWYLALARGVRPSGRLLRPSSLPGGDIFLRGSHVLPLAELERRHGGDAAGLLAAGSRVGGVPVPYGDAAVELRPLPLVPVTVLLWAADDEFPPGPTFCSTPRRPGSSRPTSSGRSRSCPCSRCGSAVSFLVDLHVHSAASGDTDAEPEALLAAALERGLGGIAFTEHDSWAASAFVEPLAELHRGRILVLRGVEVSAAEGHCLVFGADTDRLQLGGAPAAELVRAVAAAGGAAIPAHPFRPGSGVGSLVRGLHATGALAALEGCNGANLPAMNERALAAARELGLPATGGSDAHAPREVGSCRTVFEERFDAAGFLDALRAGRYRCEDLRRASRGFWPFL